MEATTCAGLSVEDRARMSWTRSMEAATVTVAILNVCSRSLVCGLQRDPKQSKERQNNDTSAREKLGAAKMLVALSVNSNISVRTV